MGKVTVSLGMNLPLSEENRFDRFTPSVGVEVDTDGDVEEQIKKSLAVASKAWDSVSDLLEKKIREELK